MLSILIPIYNAYPLVKELHSQCLEATIDFEIFCIDDASNEYESNNNPIQFISNCIYIKLKKYRTKFHSKFITSKSKKKWLLFLDCDTFPENNNFIANYVNQINSSAAKAFFGGLI
jgi:glycosyltransferase involved in cell wall biosynthesis